MKDSSAKEKKLGKKMDGKKCHERGGVLSGNMVKTSMCRSFIRKFAKTSTCRSFIRDRVKTSM